MATALYTKPKTGVNYVGWGLLVVLLTGAYLTWKYLPTYQAAWEVDKMLSETIARAYSINRQTEPERSQRLRTLLMDLRSRLPSAHVTDPSASVNIEVIKGKIVLTCKYTTYVENFGRETVMKMVRVAETDARPLNFD